MAVVMIGVDPHKGSHTAVVIGAAEELLGQLRVRACAAQAQDALSRLNEIANAVICFENDRMGDMVAPKAGIHQAFGIADMTISQSVRSIVNLIQRPGLIRIGFDHTPLREVLHQIGPNNGLTAEWEFEQGAPVRILITEKRR